MEVKILVESHSTEICQ